MFHSVFKQRNDSKNWMVLAVDYPSRSNFLCSAEGSDFWPLMAYSDIKILLKSCKVIGNIHVKDFWLPSLIIILTECLLLSQSKKPIIMNDTYYIIYVNVT
jgi:hypothetical protein